MGIIQVEIKPLRWPISIGSGACGISATARSLLASPVNLNDEVSDAVEVAMAALDKVLYRAKQRSLNHL